MTKQTQEKVCGYCEKTYTEWGNNGWPVIDAQVCNACNDKFVIPARLDQIFFPKKESEVK